MDSCKNSNKKLCVFSHSQISFRNKTIVFETQLIKEYLRGIAHSHYMSPSYWNPWQRLSESYVFFLVSINIQWPFTFKVTFGLQNCLICVQYLKEKQNTKVEAVAKESINLRLFRFLIV